MSRNFQIGLSLLCAALFLGLTSVRADVVRVDVYKWLEVVDGVTSEGWEVHGVDEYADKGVRLNTQSEYVLSPCFPGCVTQLVLTVRASSEETACFLTAVPVLANAGARAQSALPTDSYVTQVLSWDKDDGVRQFRFQNIGKGNAGWGIRSLDVFLDRVESPRMLPADDRYSDALTIRWEPDGRAVVHELEIDRVETFPSRCVQLERWDFSVLTNGTGNPLPFPDVPGATSLPGVSGAYLNVQPHSGGYLQAGNTKGAGRLSLSLSSDGLRTALMRLYRSKADGTDGPVSVLSVEPEDVTNRVDELFLTTVPCEFVVSLPENTRELLVVTTVKSRRIRVEDVRIVADYVAGYSTTNAVVRKRTRRCDYTARGLVPGEWLWRVRSFDAGMTDSAWSPSATVTLDPAKPRRPEPGLLLLLR